MPHEIDDRSERQYFARRSGDDLESRVSALEIRVVILETKVTALISTMNSRFDALDAGYKLIVEKLERLNAVRERMIGAFVLVSLIGVTGVVAWVLAVARVLKVGP